MKRNLPVTDNEVHMKDGEFIVSTTDLKGIITSVNRTFVEISGFTEAELLGRNHNIVRHPDMPAAAFQNLWDTVKADKPWSGYVKNRCKNGDFYWVNANVTPIREGGRTTGYMSVRTRPAREEIEAAAALYRQINTGKAKLAPSPAARVVGFLNNFGIMNWMYGFAGLALAMMGSGLYLAWAQTRFELMAMAFAAAACSVVVGAHLLGRHLVRPIRTASRALGQMAESHFSDWVATGRDDEAGLMLQNLKSAQIRLGCNVNETHIVATEVGRIKRALDTAGANVMIADQDYNIIYINDSLTKLLRHYEADIRTVLPEFSVDSIQGSSMDIFHKDPAHQRALLDGMTATVEAEVEIGDCHMQISANPIVDGSGRRVGTVAEWRDRYQEVVVGNEMQGIVQAAQRGDLSQRIDVAGKDGFILGLSEGINNLLQVSEQVINDTVGVLGAMSRGDLTHTITTGYQGTFGQLKDDANATISKLTEVLGEIRASADTVLHVSHEIAQGNSNLSQRTEAQASSLEQTASSMEEMTSTVRQNAENARRASQLASGARDQAEQGGGVVGNAVTAMGEITGASRKIADIIGVIDEIAFQTNLLALNAAVEAARAGDQGRGFAVVASEVRNLAGRSATAAKEIKELIEDSVVKVDEGSQLVNASGEMLGEIVRSVKEVSDIIAEIAAASEEQSDGIEQVNKAIAQMDEMTQQNAALVEEAAAASEAMGEQAESLNKLVGFFQTGAAGAVASERRAADRPWSRPQAAPAVRRPLPRQATGTHGAVGAEGDEWQEF
ncbi:MAG: methyl-accepting chemotaxis protein [Pseudomonadota bacterium]